MSVSFAHLEPEDEVAILTQRVERLRSSLQWAREAIPADVCAELETAVDRCEERLALGIEFTVVALAGGTGSGKSALFNALVSLPFAVSGAARPTTTEITAAVWGEGDPSALLDWLGVLEERRLPRESELDGDDESALRGLVLLDLPDHDSLHQEHRDIVDRVVPRVDLLLWVVDPQKYADNAIHEGYLALAAEHGQPSLVVLNQVDRLTTEEGWEVTRDLQKLLAQDGMHDVPVLPASARTGQGIDHLRGELEGAVQTSTVAADAVAADLVQAGRVLERALARDAEPVLPDVKELVAALAAAAGVDARAQAAAAVVAGRASSVPAVSPLGIEVVERERLDWVDAASEGLPPSWRVVIADAVAPAGALVEEIDAALEAVAWPEAHKGGNIFTRRSQAAAASKDVLTLGREAITRVLEPLVVEPTVMVHQAYRNLDELTVLARSEAPERSAAREHEEPRWAPALAASEEAPEASPGADAVPDAAAEGASAEAIAADEDRPGGASGGSAWAPVHG